MGPHGHACLSGRARPRAGVRVDPELNAQSRMGHYRSLALVDYTDALVVPADAALETPVRARGSPALSRPRGPSPLRVPRSCPLNQVYWCSAARVPPPLLCSCAYPSRVRVEGAPARGRDVCALSAAQARRVGADRPGASASGCACWLAPSIYYLHQGFITCQGGAGPYALSIARIARSTRHTLRCAQVHGYPAGAWLNLVSWSRDSRHVSFTTRSPGARALPAALCLGRPLRRSKSLLCCGGALPRPCAKYARDFRWQDLGL